MMDNIHKDALPKLAEGIRKGTEIVAKTMGPRGSNVDVQTKLYPYHRISNDGATIIKAIELEDPIESIGLSYLKESADRSNNNSGDGSTTTAVLLNAILQEGLKSEASAIELKNSLDECLPIIEQSIHEQTRQITVDDISAVARIAGEDDELARTLGEIYKTIGKEGIIHLEGSGTYETNYSPIEGVRFVDTGYLSPYMVYDEQAERDGRRATKAVYKNPKILITKNKISKADDINPLLSYLIAADVKTLAIFTDDMDSTVARMLIELQQNKERSINILIIKAPALWKQYVFEDFAACTGATIVEDASGTKLGKGFSPDWLGTCETIVCDKEETTLIGIKDISFHTKQLEEEGSTDSKRRLAWLTTKTAILKLGAKSETELSYRRLKAEDAIFSSKLALQHGVVAGGGVCLRDLSDKLPDTVGGNILKIALTKPIEQICSNAGWEIPEQFGPEIIDAASIVLGAVRNSLGIASTLLTTSSVITLPPEPEQKINSPFPFN